MSASVSTNPALQSTITGYLARQRRWTALEIGFWVLALAAPLLMPGQMLLLNEIAILGLFALSLDLILGYAGIVSLGHAAFLGAGAYAAGLFALHVNADPLLGLVVGTVAATCLGFACGFLVRRGTDLTRLMVTLGIALLCFELANTFRGVTGGADGLQGISMGKVLGLFAFDIKGRTAYLYSLSVLFILYLVARRIMASPFGLSIRAIRDNRLRASASGVEINTRLVAIYTLAAALAGAAGALMAQTTQFVSLDVLEFHRSADLMLVLIIGGAGYLYGGILGAIVFKLMQDAIASLTPQYWQFWIGLFLVLFVLGGREILQVAGQRVRAQISRLFAGKDA